MSHLHTTTDDHGILQGFSGSGLAVELTRDENGTCTLLVNTEAGEELSFFLPAAFLNHHYIPPTEATVETSYGIERPDLVLVEGGGR